MRVLVQELGKGAELELLLARCIQLLVESVVVRREASRRQRLGFRSLHPLFAILALASELRHFLDSARSPSSQLVVVVQAASSRSSSGYRRPREEVPPRSSPPPPRLR